MPLNILQEEEVENRGTKHFTTKRAAGRMQNNRTRIHYPKEQLP